MWVGPLSLTHAQDRWPGDWVSFALLSVHLVEAISTRQLVVIHAGISPSSGSGLLSPFRCCYPSSGSDVVREYKAQSTILQVPTVVEDNGNVQTAERNRASVSIIQSIQADILRRHEAWLSVLRSGCLCVCT